jgi:HSP20 family protein
MALINYLEDLMDFDISNQLNKTFNGLMKDYNKFKSMSFSTDIVEHPNNFEIIADLAGMTKDDIDIEVNGDKLVISGKRKDESGDTSYHYRERSYGEFRRLFTLPKNVNKDEISATSENGVLRVLLPKMEVVNHSLKIQIK